MKYSLKINGKVIETGKKELGKIVSGTNGLIDGLE